MACNIERPTPQDLFDRYKQMFQASVMGGAEIIPESNEWYVTSINYAIAEEFYAISEQQWREHDPRYACLDNLVAMAARDGIFPRSATYAQGYVTLTGMAGSELPAPMTFEIGGTQFITADAAAQPAQLAADGRATVRVRSQVAGEVGNIAEEKGRLNESPTGVSRDVFINGGTFCEGADPESEAQFRNRYLQRLQYQPRAANQWMLDKLLEWPCATRALRRAGSCCSCNACEGNDDCEDCGCKDCGGKLEYYVMFDNSFPCGIAPETVIQEIQDWFFGSPQGYGLGQVEVGVCGRIVPVKGIQIDIRLDIVDCPTTAQLHAIRQTLGEYFLTLSPSATVRTRVVESTLTNILGIDVDFSVQFHLVNEADEENVFQNGYGCDIEPNCDYMLCLNNITIGGPDGTPVVSC